MASPVIDWAAQTDLTPIKLAWLGDAIYSAYIRQKLIARSDRHMHRLQASANKFVSAHGQAAIWPLIEPLLTAEELDIARRGRNAYSRPPRNAKLADYRWATGWEAVLGYWQWSNQGARLTTILDFIWENRQKIEDQNNVEG